jgi:hypothetical protein
MEGHVQGSIAVADPGTHFAVTVRITRGMTVWARYARLGRRVSFEVAKIEVSSSWSCPIRAQRTMKMGAK